MSPIALRNNGTIFTEKVESLVESLEASILTYQTVATRKRAATNAFRPVWLPSTKLQDSGELCLLLNSLQMS